MLTLKIWHLFSSLTHLDFLKTLITTLFMRFVIKEKLTYKDFISMNNDYLCYDEFSHVIIFLNYNFSENAKL